jgi:hypothetical protein
MFNPTHTYHVLVNLKLIRGTHWKTHLKRLKKNQLEVGV